MTAETKNDLTGMGCLVLSVAFPLAIMWYSKYRGLDGNTIYPHEVLLYLAALGCLIYGGYRLLMPNDNVRP